VSERERERYAGRDRLSGLGVAIGVWVEPFQRDPVPVGVGYQKRTMTAGNDTACGENAAHLGRPSPKKRCLLCGGGKLALVPPHAGGRISVTGVATAIRIDRTIVRRDE
jgi:hypothetical protein